MKKVITILFVNLITFSCIAQSGKWTWISGTNIPGDPGNYGIKGLASSTNVPPSRYHPAYWKDLNGNFWMFGGLNGTNTFLNDLWKFDPITNLWTWVNGEQYLNNIAGNYGTKGIGSINNNPPAKGYGANCWTDNNNNLWLYGGSSFNNANDLWKYNISTNEWTWMHGNNTTYQLPVYGSLGILNPNNTPGSRSEIKSGWTTSDNQLWTFGGNSILGASYNDLFKYNAATNEWAHMKGPQNSMNLLGNYGIKGVETSTNVPSARYSYTKWKDKAGDFYIFAGGENNAQGKLYNDVWKYKPSTNNWTWISGTNIEYDTGTHPPFCIKNDLDIPQARFENQTITAEGCSPIFWSFGGFTTIFQNAINDLWIFNADNLKWTLVSGSDNKNDQLGNYGTKGVQASSNMIPGKAGVCIWTDKKNNLWLFGGYTTTLAGLTFSNDLWKFEPDTACFGVSLNTNFTIPRPIDTVFCKNQTVIMPIPNMKNIELLPMTGAIFNNDSSQITFQPTATTTYTLSGDENGLCNGKDKIVFTIIKLDDPVANFDITPAIASINNPVFQLINTSTQSIKYEWYYNNTIFSTQTNESKTISALGKYCFTLVAFNSEGCTDTITKCGEIVPITTVIIPNSFTPNGDNKNDVFKVIAKSISTCKFQIYNRYGNKVFETKDPNQGWNGEFENQQCDMESYYYYFEYINSEGKSMDMYGDVTLIR